jgi:large subunit ribosomal protein L6
MSRIAKAPVNLPKGVTATVSPEEVTIKGAKGTLSTPLSRGVTVVQADQHLEVKYVDPGLSRMQAGATRAHLANMVTGVTKGYEKKL